MQLSEPAFQPIWHPCTQMKDLVHCPLPVVSHAEGSYLYTDQGALIDATSSWWCKSLGHGHPAIRAAIKEQLDLFEHVIAANSTHPLLIELGEKLMEISKRQHVFFANDGSSAVEIALKLALHANQLQGRPHRNEFIALENAYHGETFGALSVSDLGLFKKPYEGYGLKCHFLKPLPYVSDQNDPLWADANAFWPPILQQLEQIKANACALIVEPIIQGAGGMRCYSADFLKKLAAWAKENGIYFIADEIMTGMGRTGAWLACQHAAVNADLICLSKGITSGSLPLSCVLIDRPIYELFYDDYDKGKSFLHSHTLSANALAISAALATIKVMEREKMNERAEKLGLVMRQEFQQLAKISGKLTNIRSIGAIVAADLLENGSKRLGYQVYQEALKRGALLRPLGNTLYWSPPLNTDQQTVEKLAEITLNSIKAIY